MTEHNFTPTQIAYARTILLIERKLEPKCDECGVGAKCQKCPQDLGGHCQRHDQENVRAFDEVIDELDRRSGLRDISLWRQHVPLWDVVDLYDPEKLLMNDLYDMEVAGKRHSTRAFDDRFRSLADKNVVYYSASGGLWHVDFNKRGLVWAERLFADETTIAKAEG